MGSDGRVDLGAATAAVQALIAAYGIDPADPLLARTPRRVAQAFDELFAGVGTDELATLRHGDPVPDGLDLVGLHDLEFRSVCAHHLLPFSGLVHVVYIPTTHLVGIGSIVRALELLSTRPQVQERLAHELAEALRRGASAQGALVVIEARHSCIADRGPREAASRLVTVAAVGTLGEPQRRTEALALIRDLRSAT